MRPQLGLLHRPCAGGETVWQYAPAEHGAGGGGVRAVLVVAVSHSLRRHGAGGGGVRAVLVVAVNHSLGRHGAGGGGVRAVLVVAVNHSLGRHGAGGGGVRAVLVVAVNHSLRRHGAGGGVSMERKPANSLFSSTSSFASPPTGCLSAAFSPRVQLLGLERSPSS